MPRPASNPPNPWTSRHVEWLGEPPPAELVVYEEHARSIVATNDSPDIPFRASVNPYRGCFHACAYCYARPGHQHLGFGAGTDFDRRIVVKVNAPALLRRKLASRAWRGELLAFSGVTDCYQPLEASYGLTRACLEACLAFRNPVAVVTKGALVRRDAALLAALAREAIATVWISVPFVDEALARAIEPHAAPPHVRLETMAALAQAGVPVGVLVAPIIPGLNDEQVPRILRLAREAGARSAGKVLLRLPAEVRDVFEERLREAVPLRAVKVLSALDDVRSGRPQEARFGRRMVGTGPRWEAVEALFTTQCRRLGLAVGEERDTARPTTYRRPGETRSLF